MIKNQKIEILHSSFVLKFVLLLACFTEMILFGVVIALAVLFACTRTDFHNLGRSRDLLY